MNSIVKAFAVKIWKIFFGLFGVLRRALCCFRKRRRASDVGLPISASSFPERTNFPEQQANDLQSWDSWNEDNQPIITVESNCSNKLTSSASNRRKFDGFKDGSGDDAEDNVDFFVDMIPRVKRQKKFVPRYEGSIDTRGVASRVKMDFQPAFTSGAELGCLSDEDKESTWEDVAEMEDLGDLNSAIKEKRLEEREMRLAEHQKRKKEWEKKRGCKVALTSSERRS